MGSPCIEGAVIEPMHSPLTTKSTCVSPLLQQGPLQRPAAAESVYSLRHTLFGWGRRGAIRSARQDMDVGLVEHLPCHGDAWEHSWQHSHMRHGQGAAASSAQYLKSACSQRSPAPMALCTHLMLGLSARGGGGFLVVVLGGGRSLGGGASGGKRSGGGGLKRGCRGRGRGLLGGGGEDGGAGLGEGGVLGGGFAGLGVGPGTGGGLMRTGGGLMRTGGGFARTGGGLESTGGGLARGGGDLRAVVGLGEGLSLGLGDDPSTLAGLGATRTMVRVGQQACWDSVEGPTTE